MTDDEIFDACSVGRQLVTCDGQTPPGIANDMDWSRPCPHEPTQAVIIGKPDATILLCDGHFLGLSSVAPMTKIQDFD